LGGLCGAIYYAALQKQLVFEPLTLTQGESFRHPSIWVLHR
jgi:hypothetical protein